MRISKDAEKRKDEIINAAEELFFTKGFDGTSTNDILEKVGIARGTLYYHFKSKVDIMDALIDRINTRLLGTAQKIAIDKDISIYERIIRTVRALNITSGGKNEKLLMDLHKPQNALLHQKIQRTLLNNFPSILAEIISEGIELGLFNTPFPLESVEMIVTYASTIFDSGIIEMTELECMKRTEALIFNMERIWGAEPGSLKKMTAMFGI